jgi:hypothetical protein
MSPCPTCVERQATLGDPSEARWVGPDGAEYCSLHFVQRFGHSEPLVLVEGYQAPTKRKAPAPKHPAVPKAQQKTEVKS